MIENNVKNIIQALTLCLGVLWTLIPAAPAHAQQTARLPLADVKIEWGKSVGESKTILTVQVCPEPPMRRGGAIHRQTHDALRDLKMSHARLQPWFPYPRLSIAELEPPANGKTSWDFSLIDPIVLDFNEAQQGRPIMLNMAIPGWLFKGPRHRYPDDPNEIDWAYEFRPDVGTEFRDPTFKEAVAYFRRIAEWYIKGGFTDEYGKQHASGHRLKIDYWEVLNEQDGDIGHKIDPRTYTAFYDAVVSELKKIDPAMKFSGLALGSTAFNVNDEITLPYFEHFLNPKNHQPDIPLDMVSYHKYVIARANGTLSDWQREMFADTDRFLETVRKIEKVRRRLSPGTKTFISEFGLMSGLEMEKMAAALKSGKMDSSDPRIPGEYWTLGASIFAYGYLGALREGVDMVAAAELVDYPGQLAGTNLIHWQTGEPNAVYRVVKLLHEQLPPGGSLVRTDVAGEGLEAQAFDMPGGRKLLLINKTHESRAVHVDGAAGAVALSVDSTTQDHEPRRDTIMSGELVLQPQAVTVITWEKSLR